MSQCTCPCHDRRRQRITPVEAVRLMILTLEVLARWPF